MAALVDQDSPEPPPDHDPDASGQPSGHEVPIAEAAAQLHTSTEALRKRIARGTLRAFKRDRQWFVLLDDTADTSGPASGTPSGAPSGPDRSHPDERPDPSGSDVLVATLQEQVDFLRHELDGRSHEIELLHEEARRRDHLLAALTQQLTQIEAPKPAEAVIESTPERPGPRPWWAFWRSTP